MQAQPQQPRSGASEESSPAGSLFSLSGTMDRVPFLLAGVGLAVAKYVMDSLIAAVAFGRPWSVENYWVGKQIELLADGIRPDRTLHMWILFASVPFIWAGIVLLVRRLRSAGFPLWLAGLFFVPVMNLGLFLVLGLAPPTKAVEFPPVEPPSGPPAGRCFAVCTTVLFGTLMTAFEVYALGIYGVGLFVGLPFALGMISALLHGYRGVVGVNACVGTALISVLTVACVLYLTAMEGAGCLLMAAPIWLVCAGLGGVVGYYIQRSARDRREAALVIVGLALIVPVIMGGEAMARPGPAVTAVRTAVEIDATPEEVWKYVIAFPPLGKPDEILFRMGIAYPKSATIAGTGAGAVRRCNFSTGTFVEPIEIWDEPRLLKFSVTENPPPMRELSFHDDVDAPHLHGFLVSRSGQFRLTGLAGGRTLLEGTTWYQNDMAPGAYWRLWSDAIIHRIHLRVLRHIQGLCEAGGAG